MTSSGTTRVDRHQNHQTLESCFTESSWIDPFKLEAFEYQELEDVTKEVTRTFDHLTKISPLWLGIEHNKVGGRTSFSRGEDKDGERMMFGDWRLDDPLVDVFEGETDTVRSDKQETLRGVDSFLTSCGENIAQKVRDLKECTLSFEKATEKDLPKRLDTLAEVVNQREREGREKVKAAQTGIMDVNTRMLSRFEDMALTLKDRRQTVLEEMIREWEACKRKILGTSQLDADPHEISRMLFNKNLEEVALKEKLKQRQRLLDLRSSSTLNQEKIEGVMLKASRDHVQSLMNILEKMQTQQARLSTTLLSEKRKVAALRLQVSSRLGISPKKAIGTPEVNGNNTDGNVTTTKESDAIPGITLSRDVKSGSADEERQEGEIEEVDLLEECDMLEQENVRLRQRLEKAELAMIQKNHDKEDPDAREDPRVIQMLQKKKQLEDRLEELQHIIEKRSKELKRMAARQAFSKAENGTHPHTMRKGSEAVGHNHGGDIGTEVKTLERNIMRLRSLLVLKLTRNIVRRILSQAGGLDRPFNDSTSQCQIMSTLQSAGLIDTVEIGGSNAVPSRKDQTQATILLRQRQIIRREIELTAREEEQIEAAIVKANGGRRGADIVSGNGRIQKVDHASSERNEAMDETTSLSGSRLLTPPINNTPVTVAVDDSDVVRGMEQQRLTVYQRLAALRTVAKMSSEKYCDPDHDSSLKEAPKQQQGVPDDGKDATKEVLPANEGVIDEETSNVLDIIELLEIRQSLRRKEATTVAKVKAITLSPESPAQREGHNIPADQVANAFGSSADDDHGKTCSIEEDHEPAHATRGSIGNDGARDIPVSPSYQATPFAAGGEEATTGLVDPSATEVTYSTAKEIPQEGGAPLKEATPQYPSAKSIGNKEAHHDQNEVLQSRTTEPKGRTSTMAPSTGGDETNSKEGVLVQNRRQRQIRSQKIDEGAGASRSACRENEQPRKRQTRAELLSGMTPKHEIIKDSNISRGSTLRTTANELLRGQDRKYKLERAQQKMRRVQGKAMVPFSLTKQELIFALGVDGAAVAAVAAVASESRPWQIIAKKILEPICLREKPVEAPESMSVSYRARSGRYFHGVHLGQNTKPSKTSTREVDGDEADGARFFDPRRSGRVVKQKVDSPTEPGEEGHSTTGLRYNRILPLLPIARVNPQIDSAIAADIVIGHPQLPDRPERGHSFEAKSPGMSPSPGVRGALGLATSDNIDLTALILKGSRTSRTTEEDTLRRRKGSQTEEQVDRDDVVDSIAAATTAIARARSRKPAEMPPNLSPHFSDKPLGTCLDSSKSLFLTGRNRRPTGHPERAIAPSLPTKSPHPPLAGASTRRQTLSRANSSCRILNISGRPVHDTMLSPDSNSPRSSTLSARQRPRLRYITTTELSTDIDGSETTPSSYQNQSVLKVPECEAVALSDDAVSRQPHDGTVKLGGIFSFASRESSFKKRDKGEQAQQEQQEHQRSVRSPARTMPPLSSEDDEEEEDCDANARELYSSLLLPLTPPVPPEPTDLQLVDLRDDQVLLLQPSLLPQFGRRSPPDYPNSSRERRFEMSTLEGDTKELSARGKLKTSGFFTAARGYCRRIKDPNDRVPATEEGGSPKPNQGVATGGDGYGAGRSRIMRGGTIKGLSPRPPENPQSMPLNTYGEITGNIRAASFVCTTPMGQKTMGKACTVRTWKTLPLERSSEKLGSMTSSPTTWTHNEHVHRNFVPFMKPSQSFLQIYGRDGAFKPPFPFPLRLGSVLGTSINNSTTSIKSKNVSSRPRQRHTLAQSCSISPSISTAVTDGDSSSCPVEASSEITSLQSLSTLAEGFCPSPAVVAKAPCPEEIASIQLQNRHKNAPTTADKAPDKFAAVATADSYYDSASFRPVKAYVRPGQQSAYEPSCLDGSRGPRLLIEGKKVFDTLR